MGRANAIFRLRTRTGRGVWARLLDDVRVPENACHTAHEALRLARFEPLQLQVDGADGTPAFARVPETDDAFSPGAANMEFCAPVPDDGVPCVWAAGLNYAKHARETGMCVCTFGARVEQLVHPSGPALMGGQGQRELQLEGHLRASVEWSVRIIQVAGR